ncbi:hypothetical protein EAI_03033 [Harpegnathos saltator]|uniref:Uncharacterized protein n=1 Tax=Harpegnathos saltator TaxID=610380 RepID=E2BF86_HARSA|nr:hypothetical protein EAI_03033 [Harpegnathos saltator]
MPWVKTTRVEFEEMNDKLSDDVAVCRTRRRVLAALFLLHSEVPAAAVTVVQGSKEWKNGAIDSLTESFVSHANMNYCGGTFSVRSIALLFMLLYNPLVHDEAESVKSLLYTCQHARHFSNR